MTAFLPARGDCSGSCLLLLNLVLHYPATTEHLITAIKDCGLPGRDGSLQLIKNYLHAMLRQRSDSGERRRVAVTNANFRLHGVLRSFNSNPVDSGCCE